MATIKKRGKIMLENIEWILPQNRRGYHWQLVINSSTDQIDNYGKKVDAPAWSVLIFEEVK